MALVEWLEQSYLPPLMLQRASFSSLSWIMRNGSLSLTPLCGHEQATVALMGLAWFPEFSVLKLAFSPVFTKRLAITFDQ